MPPPSEEDLRVTARTLKYLDPGLTARELGNTLNKDHKWVLRWWKREDKENSPRGLGASKTLTPTKLSFIKRRVCGTQKARGGVRKRKLSVREVTDQLREERDVDVCRETVRLAIKDDLGLKYRKSSGFSKTWHVPMSQQLRKSGATITYRTSLTMSEHHQLLWSGPLKRFLVN